MLHKSEERISRFIQCPSWDDATGEYTVYLTCCWGTHRVRSGLLQIIGRASTMGKGVAVVAWVGTGVRLRVSDARAGLTHSAVEAATRRTINWSIIHKYQPRHGAKAH